MTSSTKTFVLRAGSGHAIAEAVNKLIAKGYAPNVELDEAGAPAIYLAVPSDREPVEFARAAKDASGGLQGAWFDPSAI